jgi:Uri superfamily endonuclease
MTGTGKGSYILLVSLAEGSTIKVGSLPHSYFPAGSYAYVGSAMGGFKPRLERHLRARKKGHWHIDYLLERASITGIILCQTEARVECAIARALSGQFEGVPGFGSSDCRCPSHLFRSADGRGMEQAVLAVVNSLPAAKRVHRLRPDYSGEGESPSLRLVQITEHCSHLSSQGSG